MSVGFISRVIYIGCPILPIILFTDAEMSSISIAPELPDGVFLNRDTRSISGLYNGSPTEVIYTITATEPFVSLSSSFTLSFRRNFVNLFFM